MVRAVIRVPGYGEELGGGHAVLPRPTSFGGTGSSGARPSLMGKVPSLVFDMEDDNGMAQVHSGEAADEVDVTDVVQKLQSLLEPWSEAEYMLLLHVRFAREDAAKRGYVNALPDLADTLRRLGYTVKIRTALGGGGGGACLRNLRHSFLTVGITGPSGERVEYVVDPRFKEQFEIAHETERYGRVLSALGPEIVATPDRLNKVVELLCDELARAFSDTGTPLPPWRGHSAMLSKWMPRRSEEVEVSANMLNNGIGLGVGPHVMLHQDAAAAVGGLHGPIGRRRVAPMTGPTTIAQRLAMLGVHHEPSKVSPVAEGLETELQRWSSASSPSLNPSQEDEAGSGASLHLDDPLDNCSGGLLMGDGAAAALAADEERRHHGGPSAALLAKAYSENVAAAAETVAAAPASGSRPHHIWAGIKKAVAAMPQQRNTWA